MAAISPKISAAAWRLVPGPARRRLETPAGRQFLRFVPVSLAALAASQLSLILLVGVAGTTAGKAGFVASVIGAAVSYVLSRWAWGRRGRPDLLRETLPFWIVSLAAWTFLSFASHEASVWSRSMGHTHWERTAVVAVVYFLANCLTFAARFLIFHFVLFARPAGDAGRGAQAGSPAGPGPAQSGPAQSGPAQSGPAGAQDDDPAPLELAGDRRAEPRTRR
jgi:putative flippase GtrA